MSLFCSLVAHSQQLSLEGYSIQRCYECDTLPPLYEEITEIYHVDDELTELTLMVVGDYSMADSLTFDTNSTILNFNYNFKTANQKAQSHSSENLTDPDATKDYYWYSIKVVMANFQIPNEYQIMANGLEIFVSDEIYFNYISSFDLLNGEVINIRDYHGRKQWRWITLGFYGVPESDLFYMDGMAMEGYHSVTYDTQGRLIHYIPVENGTDLAPVNYFYPLHPKDQNTGLYSNSEDSTAED